METKRSIIETWFRRLWAERDESVIDELYKPDTDVGDGAYGLEQEKALSAEEFKMFYRKLGALISNVNVTVDRHFDVGDTLIIECSLTFQNAKSDDDTIYTVKGCGVCKIKDGVLKSANNYWDFMTMFENLGLFPQNSFMNALDGNAVTSVKTTN